MIILKNFAQLSFISYKVLLSFSVLYSYLCSLITILFLWVSMFILILEI